jgi:phage shock protein E
MSTMVSKTTPTTTDILSLLHFSHQQERQFIDGLSDAERDATGTPDAWSAKDFLVNIMTWKQLQTQKLAMAVRGETPPVWRDMELIHHINSQAFTTYQSKSFPEVEAEAEKIFDALITQVNNLSEADLTDPDRYEWQDGEPLWEETLGNGLWHPISELTDYYLKRGETPAALQLQETLLATVRAAKLPPDELGVALYNRVCIYATNGWPEKALALLPEALRLRPTLIEWSKHDSDLDSLRADPTFQAIFQDAALMANAPASDLISPQEAYASCSADMPPMIIDVRGPSEFAAGHVQGSSNITVSQLAKKLKQLPRDRLLITYCNMHHRGESRGERGAAILREHGFQARTIDGGYPAWKESGLPVEASAKE